MLKDDHIVLQESLLFPIDVDLKVRILGIQIDQGDTVKAVNGGGHGTIHFRPIE